MIHTVQLVTPSISFPRYRGIECRVYEKTKCGLCKIIENQENRLCFHQPQCPGLKVYLSRTTVPHVAITINPARILGGGYHDLCALTPALLNRCMDPVARILREFEIGCTADQLILSRIDCTVDVQFPQENALEAFLACAQRTNLPRGYHVERFGKKFPNHKGMNRHSFRMTCRDVCLTIYDKSFQLVNEGLMDERDVPPDRLRFEAAFRNSAFQRLFTKYGGGIFWDNPDDHGARRMAIGFSNLSMKLLQDYFRRHMTPGQYMSRDLTFQRVDSSSFSKKVKLRMKRVLTEVSRYPKSGISAVLKDLRVDGFSQNELQYLMKCFEKINLNPATINSTAGYEMFPSVAELLSDENRFAKPFSDFAAEKGIPANSGREKKARATAG